jgi:superfamily II DNA/RNA helicase
MQHFTELNLPASLLNSLKNIGFDTPTPIQQQAIPLALEGRDVLGSAQTGTGKTGAFGIPLIAKLLESPRGTALVLTPTRELAMQVLKALESMIAKTDKINTALLIGGDPMPKQLQQLRMRPRLIVGTPGRINDHLERGSLMLHDAGFLVLDETDRMLDMGFSIQIDNILKYMPKKRQTLLFSATLPANIVNMANRYMVNPARVAAGEQSAPATNITHEVLHMGEGEKYSALLKELQEREGSVIVFVKTKWNADKMAERLRRDFHQAEAIHGDLRQNKRDRVIGAFRNKKYRVLVATDIAARGLDIPHIEHVVNYDLPQCAEDYIHRIGRTARAGATGAAICFVSPDDMPKWAAIHRLLDPTAPAIKVGKSRSGGGKAGGGARRSNSGNGQKSGNSFYGNKNESRGARPERADRAERGERSDRSERNYKPAARAEGGAEGGANQRSTKPIAKAKPFERNAAAGGRNDAAPRTDGAPRMKRQDGSAPAGRRTYARKSA